MLKEFLNSKKTPVAWGSISLAYRTSTHFLLLLYRFALSFFLEETHLEFLEVTDEVLCSFTMPPYTVDASSSLKLLKPSMTSFKLVGSGIPDEVCENMFRLFTNNVFVNSVTL